MSFDKDVALVTGAARGLGFGMAQTLAERGATVVIADLTGAEEAASRLSSTAHSVTLNVTDSSNVDAVFAEVHERFGRLDIVVNNAGTGQDVAPIEEITDAEWERVLRVNLTGTFYCARAAATIMKSQLSGRIVNVASINGENPAPMVAAYNVAKAGVISLTRTMAAELADWGIRVNAISPGPVYTDFNRKVMAQRAERRGIELDDMVENTRNAIPLGRWGEPSDIGDAVAFLSGHESSWITGVVLRVSGGLDGVAAPVRRPS